MLLTDSYHVISLSSVRSGNFCSRKRAYVWVCTGIIRKELTRTSYIFFDKRTTFSATICVVDMPCFLVHF